MKARILGLSLLVLTAVSFNVPQAARADAPHIVKTAGEVFLKGSIDGKSMFLVLGMQDGWNDMKHLAKNAVAMEDLVELGKDFYDPEHDEDIAAAVRRGGKYGKKLAPRILTSPWKSLKEIPGAFEVNLDRASTSYYNSSNSAVGVLKWSGWATVAVLEGSYYLVLEAPVKFAFYALATAVAVPGPLALEVIDIAFDALTIPVRFVLSVGGSLAVGLYSFVSSTTATTLTLITAGGVAVYKGTKWLTYSLPRKAFYPVRIEKSTDLGLDEQKRVASAISDVLASLSLEGLQELLVKERIGKFKSRFELRGVDLNGRQLKVAVVQVGIKKKKVVLRLEFSRKYLKLRSQQSKGTSPKVQLGIEGSQLLERVDALLHPSELAEPAQPSQPAQP